MVQDVVGDYMNSHAHIQEMLDSRYDDLKSGRIKPIPGEEIEAHFRKKAAAARRSQPTP